MNGRHEIKHIINVPDYLILRSRLRPVMRPDPHTGADGLYHIRSLYFDDGDDTALAEKVDGVRYREKYRIRLYEMNTSVIHLEKKIKDDTVCRKLSCSVTAEECGRLLAGDTAFTHECERPLLRELGEKMEARGLRPRTVVDYTREPYLYDPGNVRVTFDSCIRTGIRAVDFLSPSLITVPALDPGRIVLEVKYDAFLPEVIRRCLQIGERLPISVSKYAQCRIYG